MSQGVELINLARTTYLRIIPYLQPAAQVALAVIFGALGLGPDGVFLGAAAGAALTVPQILQWIRRAFVGLTGVLFLIDQYPELYQFVRSVLERLGRYLRGEHAESTNQGNQALRY